MFGFKKRMSLMSLAKPSSLPELRKRTKIVVIDDDKNAFPIEALRQEGYTIDYWPEVQSMDRLERGDYDIIVLDIAGVAMKFSPDEDGLGVLQHLKRHNPTQIIVAFSGQSFDLSKQDFFKLADDTMPKPVSILKCKQVLDQLIETKMTVRHLWETLTGLMRSEGIPEKKIAQLEANLVAALSAGTSPDARGMISGLIDRTDVAVKAASVLVKIAAIFGL
jgi:CheY-like chemotaxis protein